SLTRLDGGLVEFLRTNQPEWVSPGGQCQTEHGQTKTTKLYQCHTQRDVTVEREVACGYCPDQVGAAAAFDGVNGVVQSDVSGEPGIAPGDERCGRELHCLRVRRPVHLRGT